MTIKDIAVAAGVSVSTVSKIINQKDSGISEDTRRRVLKIIEESNYIPYAGVRGKLLAKNNLIALVVPSLADPFYSLFAEYAQYYAHLEGYPLIIHSYAGNSENEAFILSQLSESYFSGLLSFPRAEKNIDFLSSDACNIANVVLLDSLSGSKHFPVFTRDFSAAAELGTAYLLKHEHRRIAFVLSSDTHPMIRNKMIASYKAAFAAVGLSFDEQLIILSSESLDYILSGFIDSGIDAIICQTSSLVTSALRILNRKLYKVPDDVSVLCLEDSPVLEQFYPSITAVRSDYEELARLAVDSIILKMSGSRVPLTTTSLPVSLIRRSSVLRRSNTEQKIVVAGALSMYVTVTSEHVPKLGEITFASSQRNLLGGKGANIAVGVNSFGADAFMIGKLGNDVYGKQLLEWLVNHHVDVRGVTFSPDNPSGTAFISIQEDGQASAVVNPGANADVTPQYIEENRDVFNDARFCIVQLGIHLHSAEKICRICREMNVKVLLKPSSGQFLSPEVLDRLFLLVMNQEEAAHILPDIADTAEQAKYFISCGVENVIITLGEKGSVYATDKEIKEYPPADFPAVDTVGAGDVFISCLAVQLLKGFDWDRAIRIATIAASYSVSQEGTSNNYIDPDLLEGLYKGKYLLQAINNSNETGS